MTMSGLETALLQFYPLWEKTGLFKFATQHKSAIKSSQYLTTHCIK